MRLLLVHPGASWATHDVFMGILDALQAHAPLVQTQVFPLDLKIAISTRFLRMQTRYERRQGLERRDPTPLDVQLQACDSIITRCLVGKIDWCVVVSSMFVPPAILQVLRLAGIKVAVVMTESPYDENEEARIAKHANVVFTNELRTAERHGWTYLPHAWRKTVHSGALPVPDAPEYRDRVVFVGSGFPERIAWLERFVSAGAPLDLYGSWDAVTDDSPLKKHIVGDVINNDTAAVLYQQYGCALNLYRTSRGWDGDSHIAESDAWSLNPRAYELAALGVPHISSPRGETRVKFGDLVPEAESPEAAADYVSRFLGATSRERKARGQALQRVVMGDHWDARLNTLMRGLHDATA